MPYPTPLQQIVDFLRAGYPEGLPDRDYQPLLALLAHDLGPVPEPDDPDVLRVRRRLEAAGWHPSSEQPAE